MGKKTELRRKYQSEYYTWQGMKQRCYNPKATGFKNYGGRGIFVSDDWQTFERFINDMGPRPHGMSLDRIDVHGPYSAENCRWASWVLQNNNKTKSICLEIDGITKSLYEWSLELDFDIRQAIKRYKRGCPIDVILGRTPEKKRISTRGQQLTHRGLTNNLVGWARHLGVSRHSMKQRLSRSGWTQDQIFGFSPPPRNKRGPKTNNGF